MPASSLLVGSQYSNRQAVVLPVLLSKWSLVTQRGWGLQHSTQPSAWLSAVQGEQPVFLGAAWCVGLEPERFSRGMSGLI